MQMPRFEELMMLSPDQLRTLNSNVCEALKMKRDEQSFSKSLDLQVGDTVEWDSRKRGYGVLIGKIIRKKVKNAVVDAGRHGSWNVPMGVLRKTDKKVVTFEDFKFTRKDPPPSLGSGPFVPTPKHELREGDEVEFEHPKQGMMQGMIFRMKRKKAIVDTGGPKKWDVPFDMLRKVGDYKHPEIEMVDPDKAQVLGADVPEHDCMENAGPYQSRDGGHGFECKICHKFLQAG